MLANDQRSIERIVECIQQSHDEGGGTIPGRLQLRKKVGPLARQKALRVSGAVPEGKRRAKPARMDSSAVRLSQARHPWESACAVAIERVLREEGARPSSVPNCDDGLTRASCKKLQS